MTRNPDPLRRLRAAHLSTRMALSSLLRLAKPQSLGRPQRRMAVGAPVLRVWASHHAGARSPAPLYLRDTLPPQA